MPNYLSSFILSLSRLRIRIQNADPGQGTHRMQIRIRNTAFQSSVVDPLLFFSDPDPDPIFRQVLDPDKKISSGSRSY
jgi:hypothetical protein